MLPECRLRRRNKGHALVTDANSDIQGGASRYCLYVGLTRLHIYKAGADVYIDCESSDGGSSIAAAMR